jgi:hypothetical protein
LNEENLTIDKYNKLLKSASFYDFIHTETFLIFQTDSMIFSKNKDKIYDFLQYDYVGAPWQWSWCYLVKNCNGNGGFSLRKKSKMLDIIHTYPSEKGENEDVYFSKYAENTPPYDTASIFSIESVYYEEPFGCHKCWNYLSRQQMSRLRELHEGLELLEMYNK